MTRSFTLNIFRTLLTAVSFCMITLYAQAQDAELDPPHDAEFAATGCLTCHDIIAFDQPNMIPDIGHVPINKDDTQYNNICWSCHNGLDAANALTHSSITTSNKYGDWSVGCSLCHNQHVQQNAGGKFVRSIVDLSKIDIAPAKSGAKTVVFSGQTGPNSFADGDTTLNGICEVCHTQTTHFKNDGSGTDQLHSNVGPVAGTNCMKCHIHGEGFTGNGHINSHFRWDGGCKDCHGAGAGAEAVVSGIHTNDCNLCHTTGGPYDATNNKVGDNGKGDATLAEGDAGTWTSSCLTCHNKTDVPGFHGITLAEVSPIHENLGSSRGAWADSGGTIPSYRAASYSGKIDYDTYGGLLDADYNCADCHDLQRTGFTPLEALEVHLFESGRGSGSCIICHRASTVADEITAGLGGTTIECEDCHSLANGNGPSGKKMYQYDGARHHKTIHAQSGNCTRCHADPRPADLSTEPGYAGTAAINDGSDADGITWNDGFDDDFGINYTHPGGMPTQMGCRLCHTNYETYTVDVLAESVVTGSHDGADNATILVDSGATWTVDEFVGLTISNTTDGSSGTITANTATSITAGLSGGTDDDWDTGDIYRIEPAAWDTSELKDLHGYNKSDNPDYSTSGLTIYASDFDARGTSLQYQDRDNLHEIRGAQQTTQVALASHRIGANDGSSKIEVFNYGACFACHTVQARHAAPVPDQDYDTPVKGYTPAERNTHPHDALRYSPGRSVFNDFRGTAGDAWDDHRKPGGFPGWNTDWPGTAEFSRRGYRIFGDAHADPSFAFFDNINNYSPTSLAAVPVTANVNDLESLPGMTGPYNIRNFDSGPSAPVIDDITITVAQWTGSEVYVEATSILGAAQNFSFTYTGAGGPCNTSMTWDTDHYKGTCVAASGYTSSDTVTVFNNTTAADDEKTRSLDDLTINPSLPVLTSITLADNDPGDPAPAEPGYTNDDAGEVQVTIVASNYPTEVRLSESSDFNGDTDPWTLFDSVTTFTFSNTTNEEKTVYCQVRNGAGVSVDILNDIIILDTIDPTIQGDTLTAPMGGELWGRGSTQSITWTDTDITDDPPGPVVDQLKTNPIFLKYSFNSGSSYPLTIASNESNDGSYSWTISYGINYNARVMLVARDKAGNEGYDDSDRNFAISHPYIVTNTNDAGAGSLRQVLSDLLTAGGGDNIWFNIPDTDPNVINGTAVINVTGTDLPLIDQNNITIDGASQTALQGDDNPYGPEIRINDGDIRVNGFNVTGDSVYFENLQITGFSVGIISTGSDTSLEYNHLGISSDTGGYANGANGTNARLTGQYPNVYNENYISCATGGGSLILNDSTDAWVDGNTFGLFPDGSSCPNGTYTIYSNNANDAYISDNIFSGSTYSIFFNGSAQRAIIRGNQIGVKYGVEGEQTVGGLHNGSDNVAVFEDSLASWTVDEFVGSTIRNRSDGSSATITANTATTITAVLNGGADNDWDTNDVYLIESNDAAMLVDSWANWTVDEFAGKTVHNLTDGSSGTITANTATTITAALSGGTENDWDAEDAYAIDTWIDLSGPTYGFYVWSNTSGGHTIGGSQVATADNNLRHSNVIGASNTGIYFHQTQNNNYSKVYGNFIGTNPEEDESFPASTGILTRYIWGAYIGGSGTGEAGNVIANMTSYGLSVYTDGTGARYIGIRENSFYNNGDDSGDDAIYLSTDGNSNITRPTIDYLDSSTITVGGVYGGNGTTQNGDIIEVYLADFGGTEYGEGKTFITSAVVAFGETTVNIDISGTGLNTGDWVAVTRTSHWPATPSYETSAFSEHARIPGPAVPTLAWTGETNYSADGVNPQDAASGSEYEFRVQYTDTDDDPPTTVEVWIDEDDSGTYESHEKHVMDVASDAVPAQQDGVYTNGEIYSLKRNILSGGDNELNYRFNASDGASTATGSPTSNNTFTLQACGGLTVDPGGTYFEAEDFSLKIAQGSATLVVESSQAGYNGTGYLRANGTTSTTTPPTEEETKYSLYFPTPGVYTVWIRAMGTSSSTNSIFVGADGAWTGAFTTNFTYWSWIWTKSLNAGSSTITIDSAGFHTVSLWPRENNFRIDAIYLTQGGETPTDGTVPSGSVVVDPSACASPDLTTVGVATATASSDTTIGVSMPYTDDLNTNNTYTVDYRLDGAGSWTNWVTSAPNTASPYTTTIPTLTPGSAYDVRMTYNDVDGVNGTSQQTVSGIAVPDYDTTAGAATASMASSSSISVSMPYTFDDNDNNTYTVDYRLDGAGSWTNWVTNAPNTASPYSTTITSLTPGSTYDVRMTYNDIDGVNGTQVQTVSGIALPLDETTAGAATAVEAGHVNIDVSMPYTNDGNSNNTYTVDYKLSSEPTVWTNWVTAAAHTASPFTVTISGLTPTESYDVRMTYNDADGVSGTNPQTVTSITLQATPTYEVVNTNDSGAGSLRQVLTDMIDGGGYATLTFNIPGTDPNFNNGVAVITLATELPDITKDECVIDGTSQTTNRGDTNANGPEVVLLGSGGASIGFDVTADGAIIKGLQMGGFNTGIRTTGADTEIYGNYLGYSVDNTPTYTTRQNTYNITLSGTDAIVGSSTLADRNYITNSSSHGVYINGATGTDLINNVIGMRSNNTLAANGSNAVYNLSSSTGLFQDNVILGSNYGLYIIGNNNVIKGNTFGVYYNAGVWTQLGGQTNSGIRINSGTGNIIGGSTVAADDATLNDSNVFAPATTFDYGIYMYNPADYGTEVHGNFIGTNPEKDETFAGGVGIFVEYPTGIIIGGGDAGEAPNVIANMASYGIWLRFLQANYIGISQNSFYNNGNNSGDDAIFLQNSSNSGITRPTITSATATTVSVSGVYGGDGGNLAGDIVEVYIADFGGTENGEGKTFVTSAVVPFGQTTINITVTGLVNVGDWVTVTRTNHNTATPSYQTSAFSANLQVVP